MTARTSDWSIEPLEGSPANSRFLFCGAPEAKGPGVALEAQFSVPEGYLLFTTDDVPFEEILHIILLDRNKHVVETKSIGKPYSPAIVGNFQIEGDTILFDFPANTRWRASIRPKPLIGGRIKVERSVG